MTIKFTIEDPILDESVIHAAHRRHRLRAFGYLALAFFAFALGLTAIWFGAGTDSVTGHYAWALSALGLASLTTTVAAIFKSAVNADLAADCGQLSVGWCEEAMTMAKKHPELESYRKAVAATRQFVHGDFSAMAKFAKAKPSLDACKALHQVG
jgi:hypothetical protein